MENDSAFRPGGNTIAVTANISGSLPTPVQIGGPASGDVSVLVWNSGTNSAFASFSTTSAGATSGCVVPTGTGQPVLPIPAGTVQTFTLTGLQVTTGGVVTTGLYVTAITASGTAVLYITPGNGV